MIQQTIDAKPRGQHPTVFDAAALRTAIGDAFLKLAPRHIVKSPVMAVVLGGTLLSALITAAGAAPAGFGWSVTAILLVTVLFALFTPWGSPRTASMTLIGGIAVYLLGSVTGIPTPFLASLGASLLLWGIGCAMDHAAR